MKITDVKTFPICHGSRNYLFVKVETDDWLVRGRRIRHYLEGAGRHWRDRAHEAPYHRFGSAQYRIHLAIAVPRRFLPRRSDQRGCHVGH